MKRARLGVFAFSLFFASLAAAAGRDPLAKLAHELVRKAGSLKAKRVAILAFPYHDGKISSGSSIISERLTTDFVGKRNIQVVERRLIQKILDEQRLNETGAIDPETAKMMGQVLGTHAIVTGTLIDLENAQTEVNARIIRAETGEILSAGKATIRRTWEDRPRLPEPRFVEPAKPPRAEPFPDDERTDFKRTTQPPKAKAGLRLSNENLPQGNFIYRSPRSSNPDSGSRLGPPTPSSRNRKDLDDEYDTGYSDGYWEGRIEGEQKRRQETAPPKKTEEPKSSPNIVQQRLNRYKTERRHKSW